MLSVKHTWRMACLQAECGFRTSAGISCSKMLAKLVSGMHKPDDQTVMLPCHAAAFVATLPVRAIPGELVWEDIAVHHARCPCLMSWTGEVPGTAPR